MSLCQALFLLMLACVSYSSNEGKDAGVGSLSGLIPFRCFWKTGRRQGLFARFDKWIRAYSLIRHNRDWEPISGIDQYAIEEVLKSDDSEQMPACV